MRPGATEGPRANDARAGPRDVTVPTAETERGTGAGGDSIGRRSPAVVREDAALSVRRGEDAGAPRGGAAVVALVAGADRPLTGLFAVSRELEALVTAAERPLDALVAGAERPLPGLFAVSRAPNALVPGTARPLAGLFAVSRAPEALVAGAERPLTGVFAVSRAPDALVPGTARPLAGVFAVSRAPDALVAAAERPLAGLFAVSRALEALVAGADRPLPEASAARGAFAGADASRAAGFARSASSRATFIAGAPWVGSARFRVSNERASAASEPPRFPPCRDFAIGEPEGGVRPPSPCRPPRHAGRPSCPSSPR